MAQLGKINQLKIARKVDFGVYLDGENLGEILMPKRYVPDGSKIGDTVSVMVYLDGEERLVATTDIPYAQVGQVAFLRVVSVEQIGAFCDWGLLKQLLVPFSEQKIKMEVGKSYVVYVYIDHITQRITGTMKLEKFLNQTDPTYDVNAEVDLLIWTATDIGYKAIIDNEFIGVIYKNEIHKKLSMGQQVKGYIKKVRPDGKIDLTVHKLGVEKYDIISEKILKLLDKAGGKLPYHDGTDPEVISQIFGVSKRAFKQSIGVLYKAKEIVITASGISRYR
jgi:predicted RNA-binding protein (virulence factor B family)